MAWPRIAPLARWLIPVFVVAHVVACTNKAIVAETRDAQTPSDAAPANMARDASARGGSSGNDGAVGSPFTDPGVVVNDPCDAVGLIELADESAAVLRATAYVVAFDPPRVLSTRELTKTQYDTWQGRIDPRELPGAPDCMALRADAVFVVDTKADGTHQFPVRSDGVHATPVVGDGFNATSPVDSCSTTYVSFDPRIGPVSEVRGFELSLADSSLEGPFQMTQGPLGWQVPGPDAGLLGCNRPGKVNLVAAHEDGILVGLVLHLSEDR